MHLLKTVFEFEWRQLLRSPFLLAILLFYLLLGGYSLYNGKAIIEKQLVTIDSLQLRYQRDVQNMKAQFLGDTTNPESRRAAQQAGVPELIDFRIPPFAIDRPAALSVLAVGQRDIMPYYEVVKRYRSFLQPPNIDIMHPGKQAAGNFDFAFVLVYLAPLLLIAFSYNLLSAEREQGTYRLLTIQGSAIHRILLYKLLFRFLLVLLVTVVIGIAGFLVAARLLAPQPGACIVWMVIMISYFLFWFAICYLLLFTRASSTLMAVYMLGIWLLFLVVIPSFNNIYINTVHPVVLRADLASEERETREEVWAIPIPELMDTFYRNNLNYRNLHLASDTVTGNNKRFVAYYDLLDRRMQRLYQSYEAVAVERNAVAVSLSSWNPCVQTLQLLNGVAHTRLSDNAIYRDQLDVFQKQWKHHLNHFLMYNKKLSIQDVDHLPTFRLSRPAIRPGAVMLSLLPAWLGGSLALFIAMILSKRPDTSL